MGSHEKNTLLDSGPMDGWNSTKILWVASSAPQRKNHLQQKSGTWKLAQLQTTSTFAPLPKRGLWRRRPTLWPALSCQPPTSWIWCSSNKMYVQLVLFSQIQLIENIIIYDLPEIRGEHSKQKNTKHVWNLAILTPIIFTAWLMKSRHVASRRGLPTPTGTAPHRCWHPKHQRVLGFPVLHGKLHPMSDLGEMLRFFVQQSGTYMSYIFLAYSLYLAEILWNNRSSVSTTSSMIHHNISWFLHLIYCLLENLHATKLLRAWSSTWLCWLGNSGWIGLVVSTQLKNISQIVSLPHVRVKIKNVWKPPGSI